MSSFNLKKFLVSLVDYKMAMPAIKVALVVGSLLFIINHGMALVNGQMTSGRWLSAFLSYIVPYMVSMHGRFSVRENKQA